ncbi:MAG TPA: DUF2125 domain-containing protein [Rhizomicrobium sp.]
MRYSSRFFLYAPISLLAVIVLAASLHWWLAARAFSKRLDDLNGHLLMPGVTLHFSAKQIAGFPFRLDAVFENFAIAVDAPRGPLTWTSEKFALHGLIGSNAREIFEAAGRQTISWTDQDGRPQTVAFLPAILHASAVNDARGLVRFDLALNGAGAAAFTLEQMQFHLRRNPTGKALDYVVSADNLHLARATGFGDTLKNLYLAGDIAPIAPLAGLLRGAARWQDAADSWRAAHGVVQVTSGTLRWNKIDMIVKGALSLDDGKKPAGDLSVSANGIALPAPLGKSALY